MQLLGNSKKEIDEDKDGELVPKIENVDVVVIHCNVVNNTHQQKSRVLHSFAPGKQFGKSVTAETQSLIMLKTTSAEFSFIEIWLTNQNHITLIVGPDRKVNRFKKDFKKYKFYKILGRG